MLCSGAPGRTDSRLNPPQRFRRRSTQCRRGSSKPPRQQPENHSSDLYLCVRADAGSGYVSIPARGSRPILLRNPFVAFWQFGHRCRFHRADKARRGRGTSFGTFCLRAAAFARPRTPGNTPFVCVGDLFHCSATQRGNALALCRSCLRVPACLAQNPFLFCPHRWLFARASIRLSISCRSKTQRAVLSSSCPRSVHTCLGPTPMTVPAPYSLRGITPSNSKYSTG